MKTSQDPDTPCQDAVEIVKAMNGVVLTICRQRPSLASEVLLPLTVLCQDPHITTTLHSSDGNLDQELKDRLEEVGYFDFCPAKRQGCFKMNGRPTSI